MQNNRTEATMRHKKGIAIAVLVLSLLLFALQGLLWVRSTAHAHSESDKQNIEIQHPPNEIPGIAATLILIAAAVIASVPPRATAHK